MGDCLARDLTEIGRASVSIEVPDMAQDRINGLGIVAVSLFELILVQVNHLGVGREDLGS
ncbi:hypothetical protein D3C73_474740 [compost metagenome]